jgi:hypothetical protein
MHGCGVLMLALVLAFEGGDVNMHASAALSATISSGEV